jgi:hypothetical protein
MDTNELCEWAYGPTPHPNWHSWNVRRYCREHGIQPIGKRSRRLVWALRKLEE